MSRVHRQLQHRININEAAHDLRRAHPQAESCGSHSHPGNDPELASLKVADGQHREAEKDLNNAPE